MNGVKHVKVSPYHSASNGAAERMVRSFKRSLSASKPDAQGLQQTLDRFLLTYRSTEHSTTGSTPSSLFLGRELRTRVSLVRPDFKVKVMNKQSDQKVSHDIHSKFREFFPGDQVLVKEVRADETWWPSTVAERTAPKSYIVILNDGRVWKRHIDLIQKADFQLTSEQLHDTFREDQQLEPSMITSDPPTQSSGNLPDTNISQSDIPTGPDVDMDKEPDNPLIVTTPVARKSHRQTKAPKRLIESI
ncbi:uncharacterized protein K02A2.6-like [Mya arenaria]|uniref:uncharacterized protein K02A2.6-like n=1 Tax=Mya arenaria TaxID=6604 RepID=UPI0022E2D257|nr:uncharacterized protein K02A2.6-like [Mya arenaria]